MSGHPLTPFLAQRRRPPYVTAANPGWPACHVVPVQLETGLAKGLQARGRVHYTQAVATFTANGHQYFGAWWTCGNKSYNVTPVTDAEAHGGMCERCEAAVPSVYRCFDADGRLLYVGHSRNRIRRLRGHEERSPWWPQVADIQFQECASLEAAHLAEAVAIDTENPLYNRHRELVGRAA